MRTCRRAFVGGEVLVVKPQVLGSLRPRCESGILIQKCILHPPTRGIKFFKVLQSTHGEKLRSPVSLTPFRRGATSAWATEREGRLQGSGPGQGRWRGLGRRRPRDDQDACVAGGTWDCRLVGLPGFREWGGGGGGGGGAGLAVAKQVPAGAAAGYAPPHSTLQHRARRWSAEPGLRRPAPRPAAGAPFRGVSSAARLLYSGRLAPDRPDASAAAIPS